MLLKVILQLRRVEEVEPPRQRLQLGRLRRQSVCLPRVLQLQRVLDHSIENVRTRQLTKLIPPHESEISQPHQAIKRVNAANFRNRTAVLQLQALHHELDVANRSRSELHVAPAATTSLQLLLDALLRLPDTAPHDLSRRRENQRLTALQKLLAQHEITSDDPRLQQRLFFPQLPLCLQIIEVRGDPDHQRTSITPRPQPQIDSIKKPVRGDVRQCSIQFLSQRIKRSNIVIADENQVDVRAVIQLLATELSERQNGEILEWL